MATSGIVVGLAVALVLGPADGARALRPGESKSGHLVPTEGAIEIALGSLSFAVGSLLIGLGAWELVSARELTQACERGTSPDPLCDQPNPVRGHHAAAGLSFAFAVPVLVAAGFALAQGVRKNREARRRLRTAQWTLGSGLSVRF